MRDNESLESVITEDERCAELRQSVKQSVLALIAYTGTCAFLVDIASGSEEEQRYLAFGTRSVIQALLDEATCKAGTDAVSVAQILH